MRTHARACIVAAHFVDWLHLLCRRDSLTENKLTKNIWSREKKKWREKKKMHKQQPVRSKMPLIFLSSGSRLTRRDRSAPTLLPRAERRRWREAGRLRAKRQTEHQMCVFLISDLNSLNLAFLSRLWAFSLAWTSRILSRRANGYLAVSQAPERLE